MSSLKLLSRLFCLMYPMYVCTWSNNSLHLFAIFLAKSKEMKASFETVAQYWACRLSSTRVLTCVFSGHLLFPAGLQLKINTALFPALFHPVARLVLLYFGRNRLATVGCNRNITRTTKADGKSPSKCQLKKRKQEKNLEDDKRFFKAMNCFNIQEDIVKTCI